MVCHHFISGSVWLDCFSNIVIEYNRNIVFTEIIYQIIPASFRCSLVWLGCSYYNGVFIIARHRTRKGLEARDVV